MRKRRKLLLTAICGCGVAVLALYTVARRDQAGAARTLGERLRSELAPVGAYSPAGPYVGPLESPLEPPTVILGPSELPAVKEFGVPGYQVNPVTISQYGLWAYSVFVHDHDRVHRAIVLRVANWLVENQRDGRWWYSFAFSHPNGFSLRAPWSSAMAQGQAMSVLERAYRLTGDRAFIASAVRALASLKTSVEQGGLSSCFLTNCRERFFQEYPSTPVSYVLNGFMFTLVGLSDLSSVAPESAAGRLYDEGTQTLAAVLPRYDFDGRASYDLSQVTIPGRKPDLNLDYQAIDINLLRVLNAVSPNQTFRRFARVWTAGL